MDNAQKAAALEAELAAEDNAPAVVEPIASEEPPKIEVPEVKLEAPAEHKEEKQAERQVYTMPVKKHTEQLESLKEKHARELAEREASIRAEYEAKRNQSEIPDDEISSFAEKYNTDEDSVRDLLSIMRKQVGSLPVELQDLTKKLSKIDEFEKERELGQARRQVEEDFNRDVLPELIKQGASQEHISKVKSDIGELAFTERFNRYPVKDIYFVKKDDFTFTARATAESSRGGSNVGVVDYSRVSADDLKRMSPAEAEKYFAWEDSQGGSRYKT